MAWAKCTMHWITFVAVSSLAMLGGRAEACMVCIPFPQDTVVDHLLNARVVVLARENPKKPFTYVAVETLKGNLAAPDIDLFLTSTMRRRLAFYPEHSVVLALSGKTSQAAGNLWRARVPDVDDSPAIWRSLGYASPRYEDIVRDILVQAPKWRGRARATYFMPYLADEERSIRELAYLEVGRASYDTIRKADRFVPFDQLRAFLADPQYIEWRALYILLLGIDANPEEKDAIRSAMARRAKFDQTLNLSAWATALIEIDGEEAVEWLQSHYVGDADRDPEAVLEIIRALSVHGARKGTGLRARIAESYGVLIQTHPSLAGWAARDLMNWKDWRFADTLAELRKSEVKLDGPAAFSIDSYIRQARSHVTR